MTTPSRRAARCDAVRLTMLALAGLLLVFGISAALHSPGIGNANAQAPAASSTSTALPDTAVCPTQVPPVTDVCATPAPGDDCLAAASKLDVTPPEGLHRVLQLVNCSSKATLLGAANAAQSLNFGPTSVLPRENTWVMAPFDKNDTQHRNVLTIDVPVAWENTKCGTTQAEKDECAKKGIVGPRLWGRTGCRYDVDFDKAQCETGGCSGRYDCSAAKQAASVGTTVSEWTLYEPVCSDQADCAKSNIRYHKDSPDISAVDGVNLNMDLRPLGGCPRNPFDYAQPLDKNLIYDAQWLNQNCPLTVHGQDLRNASQCQPAGFQFKRSNLTGDTTSDYAFVPVGSDNKTPVGGDAVVGCFSNCGKYAWPLAPPINCIGSPLPLDDKLTSKDLISPCYRWKVFCAGDPANYTPTYTKLCGTLNKPDTYNDALCPALGSCWYNPGSAVTDAHCNARAFIKTVKKDYDNPMSPMFNGGCDPSICTFPYNYLNPITKKYDKSTQPPVGHCDDLTDGATACIGDDTMHSVMRKAYTWPNDPQVYGGNATAYQIILAPGDTSVPITQSGDIPFCDDPTIFNYTKSPYEYTKRHGQCQGVIDYGAIFNVAKRNSNWSCDLDPTDSGNSGVMCRWREPTQRAIRQVGLRVKSDTSVRSLQLEVLRSIQVSDLMLASISYDGKATATPPSGWNEVTDADVMGKSHHTKVWYRIAGENEPPSYKWTWNADAYPAGAITFWRGVDRNDPFDSIDGIKPDASSGTGDFALAPKVTTKRANSQIISIFGAGHGSNLAFQGPTIGPNRGGAADETMAAKIIGGESVNYAPTWFGHLVGDRPQITIADVPSQLVQVIPNPNSTPIQQGIDWTSISIVLRPTVTPTATPSGTPSPVPTPSPTSKGTATPTPTAKPSPTRTPTPKPSPTGTPTPKPSATKTPTPKAPTPTPTRKPTPTPTRKPTPTATRKPTPTPTKKALTGP